MVECVEAYGVSQAEAKCKDYFDDLAECMLSTKAVSTIVISFWL
jgi:hypothetical protein